ncbi:MAG TPA: PiT family inorganic phosphate transporter, partial [Chitinophagaceae bacterium]|nr:PiT family inorganic phosphate transporter [Chitinophagaceae bacterium]
MSFIIIIIALALIFDYINGFHDAANSIATVVSTKVLTPFQAVLWAAFFNFIAYLIFKDHAVANTIGKTVFKEYITLPVIFSGLIAAIIWNLITWWFGIPSSSSHTLIGGFAGAALTHAIFVSFTDGSEIPALNTIIDYGKIGKIIAYIFLAPIIGMFFSIFFTLVTINKNLWLKVGLLLASCVVIWISFMRFQHNKIDGNISKYFKIDKFEHDLEKVQGELSMHSLTNDKKIILENQKQELENQLNDSKKSVEMAHQFVSDYEMKGSKYVAEKILTKIDTTQISILKLQDKLKLFLELDRKIAIKDKSKQNFDNYLLTQKVYDSTIIYTTQLPKIGFDSVTHLMSQKIISLKYEFSVAKIDYFKKNLSLDIKSDLIKEIKRSDNFVLRVAMVSIIFLFIFAFIYNAKSKNQSAAKTGNMFKRFQLLTSASLSVGHGGNDAQKVMGIIAAAQMANGDIADISHMDNWVPLACYLAIGLGTLSGGWKIVKTMG